MKQALKVSLFVGFVAGLPGFAFRSVSDIASMQVREDGLYNVLCMDGSFEIVSSDDIVNNNVCPYQQVVAVVLQDGKYISGNRALCDMTATATGKAAYRFDFPGCTGDFLETTCEDNICTGTSYSQDIRITIADETHYKWENLTYTDSVSDFSRATDQNILLNANKPSSAPRSGVLGQR